ncbi:MAG TPA: hypothetical protein VH419_06140 [Nocardioidaceae bacterium]|jgi:hypothetical protein
MNTADLFDTPFTLTMASQAGLTPDRLRRLVEDGAVRRVVRGVYVTNSIPDTVLLRAQAAALVISPATVLCDRTAAWLHGIDVFRWAERDVLPTLETFVLRYHARHSREGLYGGQRDLLPSDVMVIHGVQVTTPLRTALDLGCALPRRDALAALDSFMRVFGLTQHQLRLEATRYFRRRGVRQLRGLLPLADPRAESPGESWTRLEIIDSRFPAPQLQWSVRRNGGELFRLDLAYPGLKIAIEYDGEEFHDSAESHLADEQRRRWLEEHGWIVIVVRKEDFTREAIFQWTEQLRRAIDQRRVTVRLRPGTHNPA